MKRSRYFDNNQDGDRSVKEHDDSSCQNNKRQRSTNFNGLLPSFSPVNFNDIYSQAQHKGFFSSFSGFDPNSLPTSFYSPPAPGNRPIECNSRSDNQFTPGFVSSFGPNAVGSCQQLQLLNLKPSDKQQAQLKNECNDGHRALENCHGNNRCPPRNGHGALKNKVEPAQFKNLEFRFALKLPPLARQHGTTFHYKKLSHDICALFEEHQQGTLVFRKKIDLWCELERVLGPRFQCTTHVFGSTLNGFGGNSSDMDLCMFIDHQMTVGKGEKKRLEQNDMKLLSDVRKVIRKKCSSFISGNIELVPAKVPILKFYDHYGNLEVDLSCNNHNSIRNTNLLYCYSQLDWRVRPLVLTIKMWAKAAGINEARFQTLSSYTLTLMVLHYLQVGTKPAVIPSLNHLYPEVFHSHSNIFDLPFTANVPTFNSQCTMSLGELLSGYYDYYHNCFDFSADVGSVRTGEVLSSSFCQEYAKKENLCPGQWNAYVCMEEPFDRSNTGRAVIRRDKFDLILKAIEAGHKNLSSGGGNLKKLLGN